MSESVNMELAVGLREIADFLDAHPELPKFYGFIQAYEYGDGTRGALERFAALLGDRAQEETRYGDVEIAASFGPARMCLWASVKDLGGAEVTHLQYEPILPAGVVP